jgi:trk system potassium uptake protein
MRETIFSFLYDTKEKALLINKFFSVLCICVSLFLIIYQFGFPLSQDQLYTVRQVIDVLFGAFAFTYFVRLIYHLDAIDYIKSTKNEFIIMCLIVITILNRLTFDYQIVVQFCEAYGLPKYGRIYHIVVSLFLLYLLGSEFVKLSDILNQIAIKPASTFIYSFVFLILGGAGLLMLPEFTSHKGSAPFLIALFTSTSASCVTGLSVVDISAYFTLKGQLVVMLLMQFGGIGIVSFTTFFASFLKKGMGFRHQLVIQDFLSAESLFNTKSMLRQVVLISLLIEAIASVLIFYSWGDKMHFTNLAQKIYYSVFHAISAFNNGGFSLFTNGLYESPIRTSYLLHVVIAFTIIFGSLGFSPIQDIFSISNLRNRMRNPWVEWKVSTKISVYVTLALIIGGTLLFMLTEYYNVLWGKTGFEKLVISFFQSVTTRTAGFNTVDFSQLSNASLILLVFLMFIGASSGSTGGGVKTSTFLLITLSSWATIKNRKKLTLWNRTITQELIGRAFSIFVFAATFNLFMIFVLSISEYKLDIIDVVFEQISAFSTTGLSTGITASMSVFGKGCLIFSMFLGRVGTLTLLLALSNKHLSNNYSYPNAHIFIG